MRTTSTLASLIGVALLLSACNLPRQPAPDGPEAVTAAAQTVEAVLTRAGPDILATGQAQQTPLALATATTTPRPPTPRPTGSEACENRALFVDDVTIRDNKELAPGESFVKIWRLRNAGGCPWTPAYLLAFFGGHRLEAPQTVSLSRQVEPGEVTDLAVEMSAPAQPGTYQGFWKLRSPEGEFFGIGPNGDQSFWVKIIVPTASSGGPTATPTLRVSSTPTPTPTPTASATVTTPATPEDTPSATSTTPLAETQTPTPSPEP